MIEVSPKILKTVQTLAQIAAELRLGFAQQGQFQAGDGALGHTGARKRAAVTSPDLFQEARRVAKLRHPGIVPIHDVGRDEGVWYFVSD